MIDTAFILAAGRGKRLKPVTNFIPKPLVQAAGKTLIQRHLEACEASGFSRVIVNHAYRGEQLIEHCKGLHQKKEFSFDLHFSAEPEGGLETAGGIVKALELLDKQNFALINADIYCELPLEHLRNIALGEHRLGHLILCPTPAYKENDDFFLKPDAKHPENNASLCHSSVAAQRTGYTFTGLSVLNPQLFEGHPQGKHPLAPLLRSAMDQEKISAEIFSGEWHDVGTPERLKALRKMLNLRAN